MPACVALCFRLTIPEALLYTADVVVYEQAATADAEQYRSRASPTTHRISKWERHILTAASFQDFIVILETGRVLLGTAASWAILDVAFVSYGFYS